MMRRSPLNLSNHRFKDEPAYKLYSNNGYTVKKEDLWGVEVLGIERRRLMRKDIKREL